MTDLPRGYNSAEEYFADLDRKEKGRRGVFFISLSSHGQTRQGRGSTAGRFGAYWANSLGDSSLYDEAYGPPNMVIKNNTRGGSTYDEALQARLNRRDDSRK